MKITALFQKQFHKHPSVASLKAHNSKHIGNGIYEVLMLMKNYKSESGKADCCILPDKSNYVNVVKSLIFIVFLVQALGETVVPLKVHNYFDPMSLCIKQKKESRL